jgi:hypothetical protein
MKKLNRHLPNYLKKGINTTTPFARDVERRIKFRSHNFGEQPQIGNHRLGKRNDLIKKTPAKAGVLLCVEPLGL